MPRQFLKRLRYSSCRQISRARAHDAPHRAKPRGHEAAVRQVANPKCHVDLVVEKMRHPVRQSQLHGDVREGFQKPRHHRKYVQPPEHDGRGYHEITFGLGIFARRGALHLAQLFEDRPGPGYVRATGRR